MIILLKKYLIIQEISKTLKKESKFGTTILIIDLKLKKNTMLFSLHFNLEMLNEPS